MVVLDRTLSGTERRPHNGRTARGEENLPHTEGNSQTAWTDGPRFACAEQAPGAQFNRTVLA